MAHRQRFRPEEKAAFTVGTVVEWQNVTHWHTGVIVSAPERDATFGWWQVTVRNTSNRGGVPKGEVIPMSPGKVRLPSA